MASKIKVDQIQTGDGTGTIALQNQLSGMTHASVPTLTTGHIPTLTTAHIPAGNIINTYHHSLGTAGIESTSSSFVATGLTLTLTPVSANSKFWITFSSSPHMNQVNNTEWGQYFVYRDGTRTSIGGGMRFTGGGSYWQTFNQTTQGLDAPNTTSAITYTVKFNTGNGNFHFHVGGHLDGGDSPGTGCDLTILEIAG